MQSGLLIVNKEKGVTSRDVVNRVCTILDTKKVGHCGTLDPMATGVLLLGVNDGLKIIEMINSDTKEYIAEAVFGFSTDTLDTTGTTVDYNNDFKVNKDKVREVVNSFKGCYMQEVPLYSSVKVNGKRLYKYAREKEKVTLPKRKVTIYDITLLEVNDSHFKFRTVVSKGTYIRSLIRDIGDKLGILCTMSNLERVKHGKYSIDNSYKISDIEKGNYKMITIEDALKEYLQINVDSALEKDILNGKILDNTFNSDIVVFKNKEKVLAVYERYSKDLTKIKPIRVFK